MEYFPMLLFDFQLFFANQTVDFAGEMQLIVNLNCAFLILGNIPNSRPSLSNPWHIIILLAILSWSNSQIFRFPSVLLGDVNEITDSTSTDDIFSLSFHRCTLIQSLEQLLFASSNTAELTPRVNVLPC